MRGAEESGRLKEVIHTSRVWERTKNLPCDKVEGGGER